MICGTSRQGYFQLRRKTRGDRMQATLRRVKDELRQRMHEPIPEQGKWLAQAVMGFFAYHAVPTNRQTLSAFRDAVVVHWQRTLSRRSQNGRIPWARMEWSGWPLPGFLRPASCIPGLANASTSTTQGGSRVPESGPLGSVRGARSNVRPYRDPVGGPDVIRITTSRGQGQAREGLVRRKPKCKGTSRRTEIA